MIDEVDFGSADDIVGSAVRIDTCCVGFSATARGR